MKGGGGAVSQQEVRWLERGSGESSRKSDGNIRGGRWPAGGKVGAAGGSEGGQVRASDEGSWSTGHQVGAAGQKGGQVVLGGRGLGGSSGGGRWSAGDRVAAGCCKWSVGGVAGEKRGGYGLQGVRWEHEGRLAGQKGVRWKHQGRAPDQKGVRLEQ